MSIRRFVSRTCRWGLTGVVALTALLLAYGYQHQTSLSDGREFEVRLVADHLIVFWGPSTTWASLKSMTWSRGPYSVASPMFILFSPGPRPPIRSCPIPLWLVFLAAAVPAGVLWIRRLSRAPPPLGCCPSCGYNLRCNVSGVCPECGQSTSNKRVDPSKKPD